MRTFNPELDHIDPQWREGRDYQLVCGRDCPANFVERDARFNTAKSNRFLPWRLANGEIGTVPVEQGDLCLFLVGADIEQDTPGQWVLMEFLSEEWFAASKHTCGAYQDHFRENSKLKKWQQENHEYVQEQLKSFQEGQKRWRENNPDQFEEIRTKAQRGAQQWNVDNPDKVEERMNKMWEEAVKWRQENRDSQINQLNEARQKSEKWKKNNPEKQEHLIASLQTKAKEWREKNREQNVSQLREAGKIKFMCTVTGKVTTSGPLTLYQRKRGIDTSNRIRLQ
jgi:hypothetical protein